MRGGVLGNRTGVLVLSGIITGAIVGGSLVPETFGISPQGPDGADPYFDPPHSSDRYDTDSDGDFDAVSMSARITYLSTSPLTVFVRAWIWTAWSVDGPDANLTTTTHRLGPAVSIEAPLQYGTRLYPLAADARGLFLSAYNGTWNVTLVMTGKNAGGVYDEDSFLTPSWTWTSFDPSEALFSGPISDYAVDDDGDGTKDRLLVNVTFQVGTAGTYGMVGAVSRQSEMFSNTSMSPRSFSPGLHATQLSFDVRCCQSYVGPFVVALTITNSYPVISTVVYDDRFATLSTTGF